MRVWSQPRTEEEGVPGVRLQHVSPMVILLGIPEVAPAVAGQGLRDVLHMVHLQGRFICRRQGQRLNPTGTRSIVPGASPQGSTSQPLQRRGLWIPPASRGTRGAEGCTRANPAPPALEDPVINQPNDYCHQLMSMERARVELISARQPRLRCGSDYSIAPHSKTRGGNAPGL